MDHPSTPICGRRRCLREATYGVRDSTVLLCSDHAADICATDVIVSLREADQTGHGQILPLGLQRKIAARIAAIQHGTRQGYRDEIALGIGSCEKCRHAWFRYRNERRRKAVAA